MNNSSHKPEPSGGALPPLFGPSLEDNVVGTWFARLGVLALLIGAAFGYRYAVDQGLIGPEARVALGVISGFALVGWGHWARGRGWFNFAHAVSGGGLAIVYLSILAAQYRFDLISPALALTMLTAVALLSAWLALSYDSLPLAILATLGAFLNPIFIAPDDPTAAMSYLVGVDVGVVSLAFFKRWSSLTKLALGGTVAVVLMVAGDVTDVIEGLGFTTVLWVLFSLVPFIQALRDEREVGVVDAGLEVTVAFLYLAAGIYFLESTGEVAQGVFALVTGLAYAAFAWLGYSDARTRPTLAPIAGALAVGCTTLAAPLMVDGPTVQLMWAIEGAILLYVAGLLGDLWARWGAGALIGAGLIGTVDAISTYTPDRLLLTPTSMVIGLQIAVLCATAWLLSRIASKEDWREPVVQAVLVVANLLALGWLSQEARFEVIRSTHPERVYEVTQFVLSTLWGGYSAALIGGGIAFRQPWARYMGLATFALTVVKMVTVDLWQLETLQRTFAFVGLGVLMIACSFLYNRFREVIVGGAVVEDS